MKAFALWRAPRTKLGAARIPTFSCLFLVALMAGCPPDDGPVETMRTDGAMAVQIMTGGSHQNPAWSPSGDLLLFTRFKTGYNQEPADLLVVSVDTGNLATLVSDGSGNVNVPGSSWNAATGQIAFTSSRDPFDDEVYIIEENGGPGDEVLVTNRETLVIFEPTFSPDGQWLVFETHVLDEEDFGVIEKYKVDGGSAYITLSNPNDDCKEPNWSPTGEAIVYQRFANGRWDIWLMDTDGQNRRQVTSGAGNKTDASFSPDGQWIVYSSEEASLDYANIFVVPVSGGDSVRVTNYDGYDGAPSWSPDGTEIAFESYPGDPDDSPGTTIWIIEAPDI